MTLSTLALTLLLCLPVTSGEEAEDHTAATAAKGPTVCLQPLGKYDRKLLGKSVTGLKYLYDFPVKVLPPAQMPAFAYTAPRKRYRAEKLLRFLDRDILPDSGCDMLVGFTSADISTTKGKHKDWGIFGLGTLGGTSCVVSTFRLGRKTRAWRRKAIRTIKVVNHELGHVLGLAHCPKQGCSMNDAEGKIKTVDDESGLLCDLCRSQVERAHKVKLPAIDSFDWDEVLADK